MKKLFVLCSLVFCLLLGLVNTYAADTENNENSSTRITVSFKTGTANYSVNGKNVKAEASTLLLGKVFVPVNIVTDALNATLSVDFKKKTATINYNDVEIILTDKKKEAVIAGKKVKTDVAPFIKKSSFMVPISFLADTLGADVTNTNGQVDFIKEIANPNSIKDFGTLIKNTTKDKIGDSYYNWSMLLPDDLKIDYRNFNGTKNFFAARDDSYYFAVNIFDKDEDTNLDNAVSNLLEYTKDYTLIDYGTRESKDGIKYVEFVYKDDSLTYQKRVYILDTKEFDILLCTHIEDLYLDDKYQSILDSFQFKYNKDGSTEDLSDVSSLGYRKYQDTRLKWSINMHPDWQEFKDDKIQNKVIFNGPDSAYFSVEVYSLEKGEDLYSITNDEIKQNDMNLNSKLYTLTNRESVTIGGIRCNKFYYTLKALDKTYYDCVVCFADKDYKYILNCEISEKDYNDSKQKTLIDGMINSFTFKELNVKTIGKLLDPDKIILSKKTQNISEDLFSMDIPYNWIESKDNTETNICYYKGSSSVGVGIYDGNSLSQFIASLDDYYKKKVGKDFKIESKTSVSDKGTTCYKYVFIYNEDECECREEMYVIQKGNKIFAVFFDVTNLLYGTENINTFNEIWNSFTLK